MTTNMPLSDATIEAALARCAERISGDGLQKEIMAGVGRTHQARAPLFAAPRWLTRLDDDSGRLHVLRGARCTVGRTPHSDIEVPETYVSRSHAVFRLGPEATIVEDAGSTNGVFVNEARVRRQRLRDGDIVGFGKARYRFNTSRPDG